MFRIGVEGFEQNAEFFLHSHGAVFEFVNAI